ncbi:MAG TPA: SusC/RagA family TonB-linked outer membrane protein [Phnomibacter sp.]|nr:SusC/RagA family TonB-linked outer membrane protein [Phnomibacter sp.]
MKLKRIANHVCRSLLFLPILVTTAFFARSQTISVNGRVVDGLNQPISGVSIVLKGKSAGTSTDDRGRYTINAQLNDVLVFTAVGYGSVEKKVGADNVINISLSSSPTSLNEVVVVGYGTTSRKNLATAISKIDPKNVPQAANSSVAQLIFGRAPGVNAVQQSAEPGGNINISIRGRGAPLIVIDGVVMPYSGLEPGNSGVATELNGVRRGGFAGLNPADIESMEFLKDASSAIYGVNAANGVVLITTKKGKAGRLSVNYDGSYSWVKNMKYMEPLNASDYMTYFNQLTQDKYLLDKKMVPYGTIPASGFVPKYSAADIQNAGQGTDWLGLVLRDGSITNHTVGVNGGSDKATYYFSGGYFNQQGTMNNSNLTRYTGRMSMAFNFTKWLTLNVNANGSKANYVNSTAGWQTSGSGGTGGSGTQGFGALQAALAYPSSVPVYDANGKYSIFQVTGNPVSLLDINDKTAYSSLIATASLDFKIIGNELTGRLLYGNNYEHTTRDFFVPSTTFYFQLNRSRGSFNESNREWRTFEASLAYKKKIFNNKLNLDAVAGYGEYPKKEYGFGAASADMLDAINTANLFAGTGSINVGSYKIENKTRSYFARTSFDVLDRYIVQLTGRYDGYNQFFPDNKFSFFPSASLAWKLSNESFMKNISFLNMLKLRGSIGVTGEASGYAYASYNPDNSLISFNSGGSTVLPYTLTQVDQPSLQWPKTINKNIGLDFSILNDRISGSADWFRDDITRLIANATTAPLSFLGTQPVNGAHRIRTGWEVGINSQNIKAKNFQWNSTINVSHVLYKHEERFPFEVIPQGGKVDDPVNSIYVFKTDGLLQIGETPTTWQPVNARQPGAPRLVDYNNDKILDANDIVRYNVDPKLTIGFDNRFIYKQFDLSFMLYGQTGGYGYNNLALWATPAGFIAGNQSGIEEIKKVWSTTNPSGGLPGVAYDEGALGLPAGADTRVAKTNFIRCRNITLGYSFDQPSILKVVKNLRIYVDVQNAFIITDYKIADPEVQAAGVKGGPAPYPMARTFSIGVKAGF